MKTNKLLHNKLQELSNIELLEINGGCHECRASGRLAGEYVKGAIVAIYLSYVWVAFL